MHGIIEFEQRARMAQPAAAKAVALCASLPVDDDEVNRYFRNWTVYQQVFTCYIVLVLSNASAAS